MWRMKFEACAGEWPDSSAHVVLEVLAKLGEPPLPWACSLAGSHGKCQLSCRGLQIFLGAGPSIDNVLSVFTFPFLPVVKGLLRTYQKFIVLGARLRTWPHPPVLDRGTWVNLLSFCTSDSLHVLPELATPSPLSSQDPFWLSWSGI